VRLFGVGVGLGTVFSHKGPKLASSRNGVRIHLVGPPVRVVRPLQFVVFYGSFCFCSYFFLHCGFVVVVVLVVRFVMSKLACHVISEVTEKLAEKSFHLGSNTRVVGENDETLFGALAGFTTIRLYHHAQRVIVSGTLLT